MQAMVARVTKALAALALVALAAPVRAVNVDPSADGPFAVGVTTLAFADAASGRSLITELWYPARAAAGPVVPARGLPPAEWPGARIRAARPRPARRARRPLARRRRGGEREPRRPRADRGRGARRRRRSGGGGGVP